MDYPRKIYAIKHNATNRVYVGSSKNADKRIYAHLSALRGHRHIVEDMQADFDKYGEDYTITILDEIAGYAENSKEYEWMKKFQSHIKGNGYNYKDILTRTMPVRASKYILTYKGETKTMGEWAVEQKLTYSALYRRVIECGWSIEDALTTPLGKRGYRHDRKRN